MCVCWNDCFQRIFGYKRDESVKQLQLFFCGELSFDMLCNFHISKFLNGAKLLFDAVSVLF